MRTTIASKIVWVHYYNTAMEEMKCFESPSHLKLDERSEEGSNTFEAVPRERMPWAPLCRAL